MPDVVRFFSTVLLACATLLAAPAAYAIDSGDIIVVGSKGEVHITMNGAERKVRAGGVLELPATVRTGGDGSVELKQGATTVSIGPDTLLEFPALEKRGDPIDRIVQPRGNAFYNIGKREGRKLRVETPYLVGVIKGTQFNVAAEGDGTTISLFEGLLEIHAADESDVIDLKAGEIASRKRGDKSISVIKMDASKAPSTSSRPAPVSGPNNETPTPDKPRSALPGPRSDLPLRADVDLDTDLRNGGSAIEAGATSSVSVPNTDVAANATVSLGSAGVDAGPAAADLGVSATVNAAAGTVDVAASTAVDAGPVATDLGVSAAVNAAAGTIDVAVTTAVDAGPVSADLGVNTAVNVAAGTVDVSSGVGVDAGPVTADVGVGTGVDLAAGAVDTSASTSIGAGPLTTDVAVSAGADVSSGTLDTGVNVGASSPLVTVNVGADVAADVVAGTVAVGLDIAGANVGLGVDVGNTVGTVETVTETVTDTVVDVGGLLDGLVRRRRK